MNQYERHNAAFKKAVLVYHSDSLPPLIMQMPEPSISEKLTHEELEESLANFAQIKQIVETQNL